jgi:hypothetical protein
MDFLGNPPPFSCVEDEIELFPKPRSDRNTANGELKIV